MQRSVVDPEPIARPDACPRSVHQPPHMNSPPTPSELSSASGGHATDRGGPRRPWDCGLRTERATDRRRSELHGWTRGDPSVRSVAGQTCPSSRSFPNAASSGSASSNSAQVAIPPTPATWRMRTRRAGARGALGPDEVLWTPWRSASTHDAKMVEVGAAGLVGLPRSTDDVAACVRAAALRPGGGPPRSGTGLAGASTPIGDALVVVTSKMDRILEIEARGPAGVGRARPVQLRPGRPPSARDSRTCRTRPRSRCRRSGATWGRTRVARTAWRTASRPRTSWRSTWCSGTGP